MIEPPDCYGLFFSRNSISGFPVRHKRKANFLTGPTGPFYDGDPSGSEKLPCGDDHDSQIHCRYCGDSGIGVSAGVGCPATVIPARWIPPGPKPGGWPSSSMRRSLSCPRRSANGMSNYPDRLNAAAHFIEPGSPKPDIRCGGRRILHADLPSADRLPKRDGRQPHRRSGGHRLRRDPGRWGPLRYQPCTRPAPTTTPVAWPAGWLWPNDSRAAARSGRSALYSLPMKSRRFSKPPRWEAGFMPSAAGSWTRRLSGWRRWR